MVNLSALSIASLHDLTKDMGLPAYRCRQLIHWIYTKKITSISDITEFSKDLRQSLSQLAYIGTIATAKSLQSHDGTVKYLYQLDDGELIESVVIFDDGRTTLCISSQAGCQIGCKFCLTGQGGFRRNLTVFEIVQQVVNASRQHNITNIVFMGMGEPILNLQNVCDALWIITDAMKVSPKRITLSTSGVVDKLSTFAQMAPKVKLAVSLNATTDAVRDEIMPINKKFPIKTLLQTCRSYPLAKGRRITFEYVMLANINDSEDDAKRLTELLKGIPCKINLIPFNEYQGSKHKPPAHSDVLRFQKILLDNGYTAIIRKSKGADILAACGQLRGKHMR